MADVKKTIYKDPPGKKADPVDELFDLLPDAPNDAEALFNDAPEAAQPMKPGNGPVQFRFRTNRDIGDYTPNITGATKPAPDDANAVPENYPQKRSGPLYDKTDSAAEGAFQGMSVGLGDELAGILGKVGIGTTPKSAAARAAEEDTPSQGFVDGLKKFVIDRDADYERTRDSARKSRDIAKQENPASYASGHLGGTIATGVATAPFGSPAAVGMSMGAAGGVGNSDAPLMSTDTLKSGVVGGGMGGLFGKAGQVAPIATAIGGAGLGFGTAAFGDKLGMDKADRIEAGLGGLLSAGAAGLGFLGQRAQNLNNRARKQIESRLVDADAVEGADINRRRDRSLAAMDKENEASKKAGLKKFEAISKRIEEQSPDKPTAHIEQAEVDPIKFIDDEAKALAAKEKPYFDAEQAAGKEKAARFQAALKERQKGRQTDDKAVVKSFQQAEKNQDNADAALVQAFQNAERPAAGGGGGSSPDAIAAFEANIPARVQGKLDAEYQAVLNRFNTLKALGKEIPSELADRVKAIESRYEMNSPEFFDRYLGDWEGKAANYRAELEAELANMKGRGGPSPSGRDTEVSPPGALSADTEVSSPPQHEGAVPMHGRDADIAMLRAQLDVPSEADVDPRIAARAPALAERDQQFVDAKNKAIDKLLGLQESEPGEKLDFSKLLSKSEQKQIAKNVGVDPRAKPGKHPKSPMHNRIDYEMYQDRTPANQSTSPVTEEPSTNPLGTVNPRKTRYDADFYKGPPVEPDFKDSPISNAMWKKVSGAAVRDEDLSHDQRAAEYWRKQAFSDSTRSLEEPKAAAPKYEEPVPMSQRVQEVVDKGGRAPNVIPEVEMLGGGRSPLKALLSGVDYARDPAVQARVFGRLQKALEAHPNLYKKYAPFIQQGAAEGLVGLSNRIQYLMSSDPEFSLAVSEIGVEERKP